MGLFETLSYTNFQGLNLDWLLQEMKKVSATVEEMQQYIEGNLEPIIEEKLDEMVEDGTFDEILARLMVIDYVTPEMYGAKGDGETDDTAAVQAAVDSGFNVCFMMPSIYKITDTIHLRALSLDQYDGVRQSRTLFSKARTTWNNPNSNIKCYFTDNTHPIFSVESASWTLDNITINAKNAYGDAEDLTFLKTNRNVADVDLNVINCTISNAELVFDFDGRGLLVQNNRFAHPHRLVKLSWSFGDGSVYETAARGQRAIRFVGNRIHAAKDTNPLIHLASGQAIGFEFSGNHIDRGYSHFMTLEAKPFNWLISNNVIVGMRGRGSDNALMLFNAGVDGFIFSNNSIEQPFEGGTGDSGIYFTHLMRFANDTTAKDVIISNNVIDRLPDGSLILLPKGSGSSCNFQGCVISNNAIGLIQDLSAVRAVLKGEQLALKRCSIVGNAINTITQEDAGNPKKVYAVYSSGSCTIEDCKIMANVTPETTTTFGNTGTATLTRTPIDDDLYPSP